MVRYYENQDGVPIDSSTGLIKHDYVSGLEEELKFTKNNSNLGLKLATGVLITLGILGLTSCSPNHTNLNTVIQNLQVCSKDDSAREYTIKKLKGFYEKVPMKYGKVDKLKLNKRYQDFLKLPNQERLNKLSEMSKDGYNGCDVYSGVTISTTDEEFIAFLEWEVSSYGPY